MAKKVIKTRGVCMEHSRSKKFRFINVVSNHEECFDDLIQIAKTCYVWYAGIIHEADEEVSKKHIHLLCMDSSPLLLDSHYRRFSDFIPKNLIQGVISSRSFARYLSHKDFPNKKQYSDDDVFTSDRVKYNEMIADRLYRDPKQLWIDFKKLYSGSITPDEFIDMYSQDLATMPMYQQMSLYKKIYDSTPYYYYRSQSLDYSADSCPPKLAAKSDDLHDSPGIERFNNITNAKGKD